MFSLFVIEEGNLDVSDPNVLDGGNQGDASNLLGDTITITALEPLEVIIDDADNFFDDSEGGQVLAMDQVIAGELVPAGTRVEAEYLIELTAGTPPDPVQTFIAVGFNFNTGGGSSFATTEALAFVGGANGFPPAGLELTVTRTAEGPRDDFTYADFAFPAAPCFVAGAHIETPNGPRPIEALRPGDLVETLDAGPQPIRWVGEAVVSAPHLRMRPELGPVRISAGALGPGAPTRDLNVSPRHMLLAEGPAMELLFGIPQALAPASALIGAPGVAAAALDGPVRYLHLLLDDHHLVRAEGVWTETLRLPSDRAANGPARAELAALFPDWFAEAWTTLAARPILTAREGRLWAARRPMQRPLAA